MTPNDDHVICPNCVHQFRAIPVNVQKLMLGVGFEPPSTTPPAQPAQRKPLTDDAKAVIDAARTAMNQSSEANDGEGSISIPSDLAASLSLCLDEYDRVIEAQHGITKGGEA